MQEVRTKGLTSEGHSSRGRPNPCYPHHWLPILSSYFLPKSSYPENKIRYETLKAEWLQGLRPNTIYMYIKYDTDLSDEHIRYPRSGTQSHACAEMSLFEDIIIYSRILLL